MTVLSVLDAAGRRRWSATSPAKPAARKQWRTRRPGFVDCAFVEQ